MKEKLILIGAGGHCHSCIDVIELENKFEIAAIIDLPENLGRKVLNYEITHTDDDLPSLIKKYQNVLIAIGQIKSSTIREKYYKATKDLNGKLPVIKSPLAHISKYASIEEGTIIMSHAFLNAGSKIGKNCIINTKALIEHDVSIGDHCHISTASVINGGTIIGDATFIGSNSTIRDNISISHEQIIGAGNKVMKGI
jgi:sugar O-acyltransferase (sialic acid O-acetyltransferase NeuD family)